jgi:5-methylcytosine-specific restriction endonuclease McrA
MPTAIPRLCPNCGPTTHIDCPVTTRRRQIRTDAERQSSHARGYDKDWAIKRRAIIVRDQFTCTFCGWRPRLVEMCIQHKQPIPDAAVFQFLSAAYRAGMTHLQVDHIEPIEARPDLRLVDSNLRTLCNACHSARTAKDQAPRLFN